MDFTVNYFAFAICLGVARFDALECPVGKPVDMMASAILRVRASSHKPRNGRSGGSSSLYRRLKSDTVREVSHNVKLHDYAFDTAFHSGPTMNRSRDSEKQAEEGGSAQSSDY